jgi:hypothetical protein
MTQSTAGDMQRRTEIVAGVTTIVSRRGAAPHPARSARQAIKDTSASEEKRKLD